MAPKLLTLALVALFLQLTATSAVPLNDFHLAITPQSLQDDAQALLKELNEKSTAALDQAATKLDQYLDRIDSVTGTIRAAGQAAVDKAAADSVAQLAAITASAQAVAADIGLCLADTEAPLADLGEAVSAELGACIARRNRNAVEDIVDTRNELQNVYRRVADLKDDVEECGSDAGCLNAAIEDVKNSIVQIPGWINQEVQGAAQSTEHSASLLSDCAAAAGYSVKDQGKKLLETVLACSTDIVAFFSKYTITNKVQLRVL